MERIDVVTYLSGLLTLVESPSLRAEGKRALKVFVRVLQRATPPHWHLAGRLHHELSLRQVNGRVRKALRHVAVMGPLRGRPTSQPTTSGADSRTVAARPAAQPSTSNLPELSLEGVLPLPIDPAELAEIVGEAPTAPHAVVVPETSGNMEVEDPGEEPIYMHM